MSFLLLAIVFIAGIYFYKKSKPKKMKEIPASWHDLLLSHVLFYKKLSEAEQLKFRKKLQQLLEDIYIESVEFELKELDILLVAASAVIPVFYFDNFKYTNLKTVIIYPDYFNADLEFKGEDRNIGGMVGTGGRFENQMILSRKALHHGFSNKTDKGNTAVHEFVHLIDKLDGDIDGVPKVLLSNAYAIPWLKLVHDKMEAINSNESDIRNYGGTNQEEFFAVASEYFFEQPDLLKRKHPDLYKMLKMCFID